MAAQNKQPQKEQDGQGRAEARLLQAAGRLVYVSFQGIVTLQYDAVKNRGGFFLSQFPDKNRKPVWKFLEFEGN